MIKDEEIQRLKRRYYLRELGGRDADNGIQSWALPAVSSRFFGVDRLHYRQGFLLHRWLRKQERNQ